MATKQSRTSNIPPRSPKPKGSVSNKRVDHPRTLLKRIAADTRRTDFRKYVGQSGIMDCLSNVLLSLYEETEKPFDALEYMYDKLSSGMPIRLQLENLEEEKELLERKVVELEKENEILFERLGVYEPTAEFESEEVDGEEREVEMKSSNEEQE